MLGPHESDSPYHFENIGDETLFNSLKYVGKAAYTLFNVPEHDSTLYEDLAKILIDKPQPTHGPIEEELRAITTMTADLIDTHALPKLNTNQLLGHLGICMQFTSYIPDLRKYGQTPFVHIDRLYDELIQTSGEGPLSYSQQLKVALDQSFGNLPEALWRLFLTSRQYSRWFDENIITNMPIFTREQKIERMYTFARSVAACKPYSEFQVQDSAGDTYYTWTHALGNVIFNVLVEKRTSPVKIGSMAMRNGTVLMHKLAHKYKAQRLASDHTTAALYGNMIGDALVDILDPNEK